jgi:hypothetical protein
MVHVLLGSSWSPPEEHYQPGSAFRNTFGPDEIAGGLSVDFLPDWR